MKLSIKPSELEKFLLQDFNQSDKVLLIMGHAGKPLTAASIRNLAEKNGLPEARAWNVPQTLMRLEVKRRRQNGRVIRHGVKSWQLTSTGVKYVQGIIGGGSSPSAVKVAIDLHKQLKKIKNKQVRDFVEEAIFCHDNKRYRSAIIMLWQGAISILHKHAFKKHLKDFNHEAQKRTHLKWKPIKTADNFPGQMKESEFLDIIETIEVIDKSVKSRLKICLTLRNNCGHPNTFKVDTNESAAHLEALLSHVFKKFNP